MDCVARGLVRAERAGSRSICGHALITHWVCGMTLGRSHMMEATGVLPPWCCRMARTLRAPPRGSNFAHRRRRRDAKKMSRSSVRLPGKLTTAAARERVPAGLPRCRAAAAAHAVPCASSEELLAVKRASASLSSLGTLRGRTGRTERAGLTKDDLGLRHTAGAAESAARVHGQPLHAARLAAVPAPRMWAQLPTRPPAWVHRRRPCCLPPPPPPFPEMCASAPEASPVGPLSKGSPS